MCDAKDILTRLLEKPIRKPYTEWHARVQKWKQEQPLRYRDDGQIQPPFVVETVWEQTKGKAIMVTGVGQHQMWTAQYYKFERPRQLLTSGGLGAMGFGLPSAIGAKVACPDQTVVLIDGDGSFQMNIQELSTCKQFHLPIKIVALNNGYLGMVRQWQEFFHGNRYSQSYMDALPDFVKLAEAYGHVGMRIDKPSDVEPALKEAFARKDDLVFMDFRTDPTENVFPMVPGGKGLSEVILAEDL